MRVVSVEQMRELERLTFAAGVSEEELQRRAGTAVAETVLRLRPAGTSVVALVGPGNNGRDAWIAADQLRAAGWRATLYLTARHAITGTELTAFARDGGRVVRQFEDEGASLSLLLARSDVAIDGLVGIGGTGPLRPPLTEVADAVNAMHESHPEMLTVAVDTPSGVNADTGDAVGVAVQADATVVLGGAKRGLLTTRATAFTGRLIFADIGVLDACPEAPELVTRASTRGMLPAPAADSHKGAFGRLLVVAGSERYVGAVYLVCAAAVRTGAGIVTLAAPRWLRNVIATRLPEITYLPLPDAGPAGAPEESAEAILGDLASFNALAVGPGLSVDGGAADFVEALLRGRAKSGLPTVLDADGLNALARQGEWSAWLGENVVMTPHLGELRRLAPDVDPQAPPWDIVGRLTASWPATLVLKGPFTAIGHDGRTWVHALPNPGLATGGTGDVLTGIIGGLLARGLSPERAAQLGVWVHGRAGALATSGRSAGGTMASDLIDSIPTALAETPEDGPRVDLAALI